MSSQITDGAIARRFMLAGRARMTLVSRKTGTRFTYRITMQAGTPHFVSVLTGPDNRTAFTFLGTLFQERYWAHGKNSKIGRTAPSSLAWVWALPHLLQGRLPPGCEVWHEGKCGRCGRALTVPESIALGLGPECAGK